MVCLFTFSCLLILIVFKNLSLVVGMRNRGEKRKILQFYVMLKLSSEISENRLLLRNGCV